MQASDITQVAQNLSNLLLEEMPPIVDFEKSLINTAGHYPKAQVRELIIDVVTKINSTLFPPVSQVELVLTEGCNLGCAYCFEKDMLGPRRMPIVVAERAIDLLFDYSQEKYDLDISLFGGEPTLNFDAIQASVKYAEKKAEISNKNVHFNITTNGVLINDIMAKYFCDHNIMVLLSLDGLKETHDKYRKDKRGRGTFDRVIQGMNILKTFQQWVGVKMTVMPDNAVNLFNDVVGLYELGVNQFTFGHATGVHWTKENTKIFADNVGNLYRWYKEIKSESLVISEFDEFNGDVTYFGCQAGRSSFSVSVDGQISPCSKILALNNRQLLSKLGDIEYGLYCVKNREKLVSCTQLKSACKQEGIDGQYQGGCFATNYEENQDLFNPNLQEHRISLQQRTACGECNKCH